MGRGIIGWRLDPAQREELLRRFPPLWPDVIADHVTLDAHAGPDAPLPPEVEAQIVGRVNDGEGLQALVVAVDGTTERPDGGTFHITWSLDARRGRTAVQSNDVLARHGWERLDRPVPIRVTPARW